jgi:hypothetical protein
MSYESKMLEQLAMPTRKEVAKALLKTLLKHNGVIKEFAFGENIVDEIAGEFRLNGGQRAAFLETIYRKQNRVKKVFLWHRLLYRAADYLARSNLVSRPTETLHLTSKREWMLTEKGLNEALKLSQIPIAEKEFLLTKSYEVQKVVKKLIEAPLFANYDPVDKNKKIIKVTRELTVRNRAFRQAVSESYGYRCAVCGLKVRSPDLLLWEVEAAHIVPHRFLGRDDVCNGIALCRLHHWAFDVGWFTVLDDYKVQIASQIDVMPTDFGKMENYEFLRALAGGRVRLRLPKRDEIFPHRNAIQWHRENIFHKQ